MSMLQLRQVVQGRGSGNRSVIVLNGTSLNVERGERVLVEGPSGSGKTTLLAVAAGILTPTSGEVVVAGLALNLMSRIERLQHRAKNIGFVFQRSNLMAGLTALQNVVLASRLAGDSSREVVSGAHELLTQLGVDHLASRYPRELSGGEEQRVAVARAIIHRPAVLLADEPTGNLDREAGKSVIKLMTELAESRDCAVVVATHDVRLSEFGTRRLRLEEGRLVDGD